MALWLTLTALCVVRFCAVPLRCCESAFGFRMVMALVHISVWCFWRYFWLILSPTFYPLGSWPWMVLLLFSAGCCSSAAFPLLVVLLPVAECLSWLVWLLSKFFDPSLKFCRVWTFLHSWSFGSYFPSLATFATCLLVLGPSFCDSPSLWCWSSS